MDTLRDRLAELADDAPTTGAPPAELWARGKRAQRVRSTALASMVLVVVGVGAGLGLNLPDGKPTVLFAPAGAAGITLPIEYPTGEELPDLGATPGPLAAIWLAPRVGGAPAEAVGLVAETGKFGRLPFDLPDDVSQGPENVAVALSPDGRRVSYPSPTGETVIHDLVSGEAESPVTEFAGDGRSVGRWIDATHLLGRAVTGGGTEAEAWLWEPGKEPELVDYFGFIDRFDLWVEIQGSGPRPESWETRRTCRPPVLRDGTGKYEDEITGEIFKVPVLCDVLGIIDSKILLGHWKSDRELGDWDEPHDGNETVVALDISGAKSPFDDPALRRVVATAGAPHRVSFANDLIAEALEADGDAP